MKTQRQWNIIPTLLKAQAICLNDGLLKSTVCNTTIKPQQRRNRRLNVILEFYGLTTICGFDKFQRELPLDVYSCRLKFVGHPELRV